MKPISLLTFLLLTAYSSIIAQQEHPNHLKDFKIIITKTKDGITLNSPVGSVWGDLTFKLKNGKTQAIDEFGMTDLKKGNGDKSPHHADYLLTITRTKDGIELRGIEGTAWGGLSFTLGKNHSQAINQYGMID